MRSQRDGVARVVGTIGALVLAVGTGCSGDDGAEGEGSATAGGAAQGGESSAGGSSVGGAQGGAAGGSPQTGGAAATGGASAIGGASGGAASGGAGACGGQGGDSEAPSLLLLLDTSQSMAEEEPPGSGITRLMVTSELLEDAINRMPSAVRVALVLYPGNTTGAAPPTCSDPDVDVRFRPLDDAQRTALEGALGNAQIDGGTATHDAYVFALEAIRAEPGPNRFIALVTDGPPTFSLGCTGSGLPDEPVSFDPLREEIERAFETDGIRTIVVGAPGSEESREDLSLLAEAGRTGPAGCAAEACHIDGTAVSSLAEPLRDIVLSASAPGACPP